MYEEFNTSIYDEYYDYDQYETSATNSDDESYTTSHYGKRNTQSVNGDDEYDASSTVAANFLTDSTIVESSTSSQSEIVPSTIIESSTMKGN